ncbi:hypothetical protein JCM11251_002196 [Rhodosporidiobolus azoricus]
MADAAAAASSDAGTATAALLGPTSAGSQVALVLYGLYLSLHVRYVSTEAYRRLLVRVKSTLWVVFALLTAYTVLLFVDSTYWTTTTHRTTTEIHDGWTVDVILPLLAACVQLPVQAILTLRAAVLIHRRWVRNLFLGALALCIVVSFVGGVLSCVSGLLYDRGDVAGLSPLDFNYSIVIWLAASAVVDIAISTTLARTLRQRIGAFDEQKDSLLRKVVIVGYQTMAYTTILAVAGAVTAAATQTADPTFSYVDWAFWLPLPACYGLSLYTTLSIRRTPEHYLTTSTASTLPVSATLDTKQAGLAPVVVPVSTLPASAAEKSPLSAGSASGSGTKQPQLLHPHKGPRTSALYDKIESWERRASVDEVRVPMPGMRRSSSFDSRVGLVGAPGGGPTTTVRLRAEGEQEEDTRGSRRRLSTENARGGAHSRGPSPSRQHDPDTSVVDFGEDQRREESG